MLIFFHLQTDVVERFLDTLNRSMEEDIVWKGMGSCFLHSWYHPVWLYWAVNLFYILLKTKYWNLCWNKQDDMHMVSIRVRYGFRWHSWQAISNESQMSWIWHVRVPSKPISYKNGYHMHFLAQYNLKFHNKETHNLNFSNHRCKTTECDMSSDQNCT